MSTQGQENNPPAPRIRQEEFTNGSAVENDQNDVPQEEQVTPLSLMIPSFESVAMLPTPMTYTPPASLPKSPKQMPVIPVSSS